LQEAEEMNLRIPGGRRRQSSIEREGRQVKQQANKAGERIDRKPPRKRPGWISRFTRRPK